MSEDNRYLDPKRNPFIKTTCDEDTTPPDDESSDSGDSGTDELEKDVLKLMGDTGGAYEVVAEDGDETPLFSVVRTADGRLEITSEGERKSFARLTALEKKLILHDLKTRK